MTKVPKLKGVSMKDVIASLAYDSWSQPIPELRSVPLPDRHLIFEGNGLILDLLLKKQGRGTCIHIGGQVLPGNNPLSAVSDVAVLMVQGAHRSSTRTNPMGEFAFDTVPNGAFDLVIILKHHRFIVRGLSNEELRDWQVVAGTASKG
jgi:hypothetical protein